MQAAAKVTTTRKFPLKAEHAWQLTRANSGRMQVLALDDRQQPISSIMAILPLGPMAQRGIQENGYAHFLKYQSFKVPHTPLLHTHPPTHSPAYSIASTRARIRGRQLE